MSTFQILPVNETVLLTSSAAADQIRGLPAQVDLINGEAAVTVQFMDPNLTYTLTAAPRALTFIQNGTTRPIPCNAGTHSQNPYLQVRHASLAPFTAVQGERQLPMLSLVLENPNAAGSAAYEVHGLTLTVQDRSGAGIAANNMLAALTLWDDASQTQLAQVTALPGFDRIWVPLSAHQLLVYPGETRTLRVTLDLNPAGTYSDLRLGLAAGTDADCAFLDNTGILVRAEAPDAFPMFSGTVAIRSRSLKESYINYPNPFAAGTGQTRIEYFLEYEATVSLKIYSITGEPVRLLLDQEAQTGGQGLHVVYWDGRNGSGQVVLNGLYFAVLTVKPAAGGSVQTEVLKIAVIK